MAKPACLDDEDRKLLAETKFMAELMETIEILGDKGMMKAIRERQEALKLEGSFRGVLKEEAY